MVQALCDLNHRKMTHSAPKFEFHSILNDFEGQLHSLFFQFLSIVEQMPMNGLKKRVLLAGINCMEQLDE